MSFYINGLRCNFSDFLVNKIRTSLSFNDLHVNNSVEILETRLKNYLCALALNGLPFKSQLAPIQPTPTGKSEHIFINECGPSAEGFKLGPC